MDKIVVITIIAVFWLFGLLTAWSMCVVAARADRRWKKSAIPTRTRISAGPLTPATWTSGQSPCPISNACHVDCPGTNLP